MIWPIIEYLKSSRSTNPVDPNIKIIKTLKNCFLYLLTKLSNICMSSSRFPNILKFPNVIPIFKEGAREIFSNCKFNSRLCCFSKVFVTEFEQQIGFYLKSNFLFNFCLYGFQTIYRLLLYSSIYAMGYARFKTVES